MEGGRTEEPPIGERQARRLEEAHLAEEVVDLLGRVARGVEGAHDGARTGARDDLGLYACLCHIAHDTEVREALDAAAT